MFTGIVETTGKINSIRPVAGGRKLTIDAGPVAEDASFGASIAVNGVCLTVTGIDGTNLDFDVINETLDRSNLGSLTIGSTVNLERSLKPTSRLDGHFVQGHIDGTATVSRREVSARECRFYLRPGSEVMQYIIPKGSVAIDGISLTVASVSNGEFSVAIIPTTMSITTLANRKVGDSVNIESDIVSRTIIHHLSQMATPGGISMDTLREQGYL